MSVTDSPSLSFELGLSNVVSVTDAISTEVTKSLSDPVSGNILGGGFGGGGDIPSEGSGEDPVDTSVSVLDETLVYSNFARLLSDALTASDQVGWVLDKTLSTDSAFVSDSMAVYREEQRAGSDAISTTDQISCELTRGIADTSIVMDYLSIEVSKTLSLDAISILDDVQVSRVLALQGTSIGTSTDMGDVQKVSVLSGLDEGSATDMGHEVVTYLLSGISYGGSFDILGPFNTTDWRHRYERRDRKGSGSAAPIMPYVVLAGRSTGTSTDVATLTLIKYLSGVSKGYGGDYMGRKPGYRNRRWR